MHIAIIFYFILLLSENFFNLNPLVKYNDFTLSYNIAFLFLINIIFLFRFLIKPFKVNINNAILGYHLYIFFTLGLVLIFHSYMFLGGFSLAVQLLLQSLFLLIIIKTFSKKDLVNYQKGLSVFAFINCLIVYGSYFFPDLFKGVAEIHGYFGYLDSDEKQIIRAFGIMGDMAPWFLSFFGVWALQRGNYPLFIFYALTSIFGASLGSSGLLIFAVFLHFLLKSKDKKIFALNFIIVISIALVITTFFYLDEFKNISIVKRLVNPETFKSKSGAQRFFTFNLAIDMIQQSPIFGNGYGTFLYNLKSSLGNMFSKLKFGQGSLSNANNQILQVLYEGGIIGLTIFILFVRNILKIMKANLRWTVKQNKMYEFKKACYIWFLSLVIMNQTAVWMIPSLFWVLIVSLIGMCSFININNNEYEYECDTHNGFNR